MKAFEGQRKFRAPVADDFCRGLLPAVNTDLTPKRAGGALSSLLGGLKALWRGHQAD
ncbi:type III secretion effector protein [Pseudomonas sp. SDO524_S393]